MYSKAGVSMRKINKIDISLLIEEHFYKRENFNLKYFILIYKSPLYRDLMF